MGFIREMLSLLAGRLIPLGHRKHHDGNHLELK